MTRLSDNTIVQDGLNFHRRSDNPAAQSERIHFPVAGQVVATYAVDHGQNRDKETILVDVYVASMSVYLYKVPLLSDRGSIDNYIYRTVSPATENVTKLPFNSTKIDPKTSNGDTVLVFFVDGSVRKPVAWGVFPHNQSGPSGFSPDPRPGEAEGDVFKIRHQGLTFTFDDDGNWLVDQTMTLDPLVTQSKKISFRLAPPLLPGAELTLELDNSSDGVVRLAATDILGKKQMFEMNATAQTIMLTSESTTGENAVVIDPDMVSILNSGIAYENQIVLDSSGLTVTSDKAMAVSLTGNFEVSSMGTVAVSGAQGGSFLDATGTGLTVENGKLSLGSAATELLDQQIQILDALINNAPTFVSTAVGPGVLNPAVVTALTAVKTALTLLKL